MDTVEEGYGRRRIGDAVGYDSYGKIGLPYVGLRRR